MRPITNNKREIKQSSSTKNIKEPKILNLAIHLEKITAQLSDGRELSIPIDWFAKWGVEGVSVEKLKNYEIWEGEEIYFKLVKLWKNTNPLIFMSARN